MPKSSFVLSLAWLAVSAAAPAQTTWFPLKTGSSWTYRETGSRFGAEAQLRTISVEGQENIAGRDYFRTDFFGRKLLLRAVAGGSIVSYNTQTGADDPWISLEGAEGAVFPAHVDDCTDSGRIESRRAARATPAGSFTNLVQVSFQGHCADAGATQQFWAAGVGPVSFEETSFAGPRRFDLVAYRPAADLAAPEVAFTMGIDAPFYLSGDTMTVRLTLTNTSDTSIPLTFPSGQSYDLQIMDEAGKTVYFWSASRLFAMIFRQESFGPGTRNYAFTVPLGTLPAGRYAARGWLTTSPLQFAAETSFRIVEVKANPAGVLGVRRR